MDQQTKIEFIEVQSEEIYEVVDQNDVIVDDPVYVLCESNESQQNEHQIEEGVLYLQEEIDEADIIDDDDDDDKQTTTNQLTCDICDREFITVTERNSHIEQHFLSIVCTNCMRTFIGDRAYEFHISTGKCKDAVVIDRFKCSLCNEKVFNSIDAYNNHVSKKHKCVISDERIGCTQCDRTFAKLKYLRKHIREVHEKATPFECRDCGKQFNRKANLLEHELIHQGKYLAKCKICGKSYRTKSALKLHSRTHTGEKPYPCEICNEKSYAYNTDLKRHQRAVHKIFDSDRTYPCTHNGCTKVFYEPKLLRNHTSRAHKL